MKNINEYTDDKVSKLLEENGAFFAFSDKQFEESKKEGVKYYSLGSGMLCPKDNVNKVVTGLARIYEEGRQQRLKDYSKEEIIHYELSNYEAYFTGDITDAFDVLELYGFTKKEVLKVFNDTKHLHFND